MSELTDAISDLSWWRARCDAAFNAAETIEDMEAPGLYGVGFAAAERIDPAVPLDLQSDGLIVCWRLVAAALDDLTAARVSDGALALRGVLDHIEATAIVLTLHGEERAMRAIWWHAALRNRRLGIKPLPRLVIEGGDDDAADCGAIVAIEDELGKLLHVQEFAA
jgi:hypothetical protein